MDAAAHVPASVLVPVTDVARRVVGAEVMPQWDARLPAGGARRRPRHAVSPAAVYFPACVNTMFASSAGESGVHEAFLALCERAGVRVSIPDGIGAMCCGTPWKSKGMTAGYDAMRERVGPWLWHATDRGRLPVVCDAASCTEGLRVILESLEHEHGVTISVVDAVAFTVEQILPALTVTHRLDSIAVHPTCSSTRLTVNADLLLLARTIADEAVVPDGWGCCAFAGDRGLLHPELTASATAPESRAVARRDFDAYVSLNRTCELGMSRSTGQDYRHVLEVVEECTRP